ncbi:MAG: hypothetical protein OXN17_17650 [Candidatus Poribacteria bacterium]|nr:hypothetical protein [Candidatus Poribacteria bacterium]MDE0505855.1 hypothetical protein [Candidatus Poribacteria bacterium]
MNFELNNSSMLKRSIMLVALLAPLLALLNCGEDGLIQPHGEVNIAPPESSEFRAVDFPTNHGSAWTYVALDSERQFTLRIEDTRDIGGFTHRQMTISEMRPRQPDRFDREPVDNLSANNLYFRFFSDDFYSSEFYKDAVPIFSTYFLKTPNAYIETAYDAYIGGQNPIFHERHASQRVIWDFPLKLGKEWVVFEKTTLPAVRVVRRVAKVNERVTVRTGSYDAYVVEEEIVGKQHHGDAESPFTIPPAKYWVVPNVGIVKYEYTLFFELEQPIRLSYELVDTDLAAPNTR